MKPWKLSKSPWTRLRKVSKQRLARGLIICRNTARRRARKRKSLLLLVVLWYTSLTSSAISSYASFTQVEKAFKSLGAITETVLEEAQDYIETERKSLQEAKAIADSTSKTEIIRLQQQNALLNRLLESERGKAERAQEELLKRISGLLGTFVTERDRSLREAFSEMTDSNTNAEAGMVKLGKDQGERLDAVVDKGMEWSTALNKREGELKRTRDGAFKVKLSTL